MLLSCPECDQSVSDKAMTCPHCGYPLVKATSNKPVKKKHMKLPNGFGRITKLSNKSLRKPYRVMVTIGTDENGKPIGKLLKPVSYFKTYNKAYEALIEYHNHPVDFSVSPLVKDVYERWSTEHFKSLHNPSSIRSINAAWSYCSSTYDMPINTIRPRHIKYCMDEGVVVIKEGKHKGETKTAPLQTKGRIKSLWNLLLDYALEYDLVDKNYARTFEMSKDTIRDIEKVRRGHMIFSDEEMRLLWESLETTAHVDLILFQCYTGFRPQEIGLIETDNVDLDEWTIIGGMKTKAGTNRIVPIHSAIREIVRKKYTESKSCGSKYLFNVYDGQTHKGSTFLTYEKYRHRFDKIVDRLGLNPDHRAHDGRKQFITMAKNSNMDEYAIKLIVGHAIVDVTEKVYTERNIQWLRSEIEKIKGPVNLAIN